MSPKKKVVADEKFPWMLGRFSTHLKVGLVGMPNVGKSTLYNSLSKSNHADAQNFPFCTIDPNETRVFVDDERFDWLVEKNKPKSEVKAFLSVVDIAGLVSGAHKGEGLGNAFLSHISAVDGIMHVMRAFIDDDVIHAEDTVDPVRDINTISSELRLKDISLLQSKQEQHKKLQASARTKSPAHLKAWEDEADAQRRFIEFLETGKDIRNGLDIWTTRDIEFLNDYGLLTAKPVMFAVNLNMTDFKRKKNKFLKPIFEWVQENAKGSVIIPYCGAFEDELKELDAAAFKEKEIAEGVTSSLGKMTRNAFNMVNLIYFFTSGPDEVRAWNVRKGMKAPQAAGVIHTDFERGFICADVMAYSELKECGSEAEMKAKGRYRQEGKTYEICDGDVIFFKFNVSDSKKK